MTPVVRFFLLLGTSGEGVLLGCGAPPSAAEPSHSRPACRSHCLLLLPRARANQLAGRDSQVWQLLLYLTHRLVQRLVDSLLTASRIVGRTSARCVTFFHSRVVESKLCIPTARKHHLEPQVFLIRSLSQGLPHHALSSQVEGLTHLLTFSFAPCSTLLALNQTATLRHDEIGQVGKCALLVGPAIAVFLLHRLPAMLLEEIAATTSFLTTGIFPTLSCLTATCIRLK